jgi:hypothetical protein
VRASLGGWRFPHKRRVGWVEPRLVAARPTARAVAIGGPHDAEHRSTHPDMVGPVKRPLCLPERFALGAGGLDAVCLPRGTHAPLSRRSFSLLLFGSVSLLPPGGLDEHAAARSLRRLINLIFACWLTHAWIRQGLPHSTGERPAHPKPGSRVGRGFPLTVQMPQPVRPTSRVHAFARTLKITSLRNDPSLYHQHLPWADRPDEADQLPHHRRLI